VPRGQIVFVFPGQGSHTRGLTGRTFGPPGAQEDFDTIARAVDEELGLDLGPVLTDPAVDDIEALSTASPAVLQVLMFANAVRSARTAQAFGIRADVLVGHSFGEIAALTAAGWLSLADGTRVVCRRVRALDRLAGDHGAMVALTASEARARSLLGAVDSPSLAVAGTNTDTQHVVSGSTADIATLLSVASAVGVRAAALRSPFAFHNPLLSEVADDFAGSLVGIRWTPTAAPVLSPITGRAYGPGDYLPATLASHLVQPFDFATTIRSCFDGGATTFIECGGKAVLTTLIGTILRDERGWLALSTDTSTASGRDVVELAREINGLDGGQHVLRDALHVSVAPDSPAPAFDRFWDVVGTELIHHLSESFVQFQAGDPNTSVTVRPPDRAVPTGQPPAAGLGVPDATTTATATATAPASWSREEVITALAALYGEALEYPPEVFTPDVSLEADLGVDSVKQTDLLSRVATAFSLPTRPETFAVADFPTFGDVVDLVLTAEATVDDPDARGAGSREPEDATTTAPASWSREEVITALAALYGEALEYPPEVFTPDVSLEADLGVDSVKQSDLLSRVATAFSLPTRPETFAVADFPTFGDVVDLVLTAEATAQSPAEENGALVGGNIR